jgi:hypothetical protein
MDLESLDLIVCIVANLVNLLMIGIFLSRAKGLKSVEFWSGLGLEILAVPLVVAVILNVLEGRELWFSSLLMPLITFLIVELWLDYLLKLDFRHSRLLGPYLGLYYLGLMGMIGYAFLASKVWGFVTLATYFLNLLATWYSYKKVAHG